jgi:hypothetical protein
MLWPDFIMADIAELISLTLQFSDSGRFKESIFFAIQNKDTLVKLLTVTILQKYVSLFPSFG